jgi:hypothetical protein
MKVQLKYPRVLHDGTAPSRKLYPAGLHDLSDAVFRHSYTQHEVKAGNITPQFAPIAEAPKAVEPAPKTVMPWEDKKEDEAPSEETAAQADDAPDADEAEEESARAPKARKPGAKPRASK